jgi:hypothetical protein
VESINNWNGCGLYFGAIWRMRTAGPRVLHHTDMLANLLCPELRRLQQGYESSVRRWGNVFLQDAGLINGPAFTETDRGETYREKDEAKARLIAHGDFCLLCSARYRLV